MEQIATRRLVEASAALDPASRALLNLWLHRGLSNDAIAEMSRLDVAEVAARKLDIVTRLSDELALPTSEVLSALSQIVRPAAEPEPADAPEPELNGYAPAQVAVDETPAAAAVDAAVSADAVDAAASAAAVDAVDAAASAVSADAANGHQRRNWLLALAALVLVVVVVVLVLALSGGSSHRSPSSVTSQAAAPTTSRATTSGAPSAAGVGSPEPLKSLSLTAPQATGAATVTRDGATLKLNLTVRGLPSAPSGEHYEVWLYTSIIDSRPLGSLGSGVTHLSLALPAHAADYQAIDISLQLPGAHYDSGESFLRAKNPAA